MKFSENELFGAALIGFDMIDGPFLKWKKDYNKILEKTKEKTPSNNTRLLGKVERWEEQIREINERIQYINASIIPRLENKLGFNLQNKEAFLAAMFQPSTKNLFLELEVQYQRKKGPFDDDGFYELISLSETAKNFALLGDAAISMAVIYHLWNTDAENVGELTQDKSTIVSNEHMAEICDEWGLYDNRIHFDPETPSKGEILHDKGTLVEAIFGIIQMEQGFEHVLKNIDHLL